MSDINIKIKAEELGKSIENLAPDVEAEFDAAVKNLAEAAYAQMVAQVQAQTSNPKNRQDYLRGLKFMELGSNDFLIYLEGDWANKLEDGFPAYDMKKQLLSSTKKTRSGEPWVKTSKAGKKYASVPFEKKPFSRDPAMQDLSQKLKQITVENMQGVDQKLTQIFKNAEGKAIQGKVATIKPGDGVPNELVGVSKYQQVSPTGSVSSVYMAFRTVHEDSDGWQHPGHPGYNLFKQAEEFVESELENIINTVLK